ncbi:MAG: hypothetical protein K6E97_11125 [Treponema sp.]|nr:hypothetical protein [Treponema sp.]
MKKLLFILLFLYPFSFLFGLIIYRPYNSGDINEIRCYLKVTDENDNDVLKTNCKVFYAWYNKPKVFYSYKNTVYISGGMATHIYFKPGRYKISVYTPRDKQNNFECENKDTWTSNTFIYDTDNPPKVIFISPVANDNVFYCGQWYISFKAPKFYKFTKPAILRSSEDNE